MLAPYVACSVIGGTKCISKITPSQFGSPPPGDSDLLEIAARHREELPGRRVELDLVRLG
jgi:hypothetical protein